MLFHDFSLRTLFAFASLGIPLTAAAQPICSVPALTELSGSPVAIEPRAHGTVSIDANQDGFSDLAWVGLDSAPLAGDPVSLWVSLADGAGGYGPPVEKLALPPYSAYPVVGDVDDDGFEDVVVASYFQSAVAVALADGAGGYTYVDGGKASITPFPRLLNLNTDSFPDLLTPFYVSIGVGDGTFVHTYIDDFPGSAEDMGVADFNSDGIDDLAYGDIFRLKLWTSAGGQAAASTTTLSAVVDTQLLLSGPAAGLFNNDAFPDLAAVSPGFLHVWLGDGAGGFQAFAYPFENREWDSPRAADLSGDGLMDFIVQDFSTRAWYVAVAQPDGSFPEFPTPLTPPGNTRIIELTDFDGDGRNDALFAAFGTRQAHVLRNTCPLQLTSSFAPDPGFAGDPIDYRFTVQNASAQPIGALDWSLAAPPEVMVLSSTPSSGVCGTATSCALGTLAPGASVQIDVNAQLAAHAEGFTGPTATVVANGVGPFSWRARHWSTDRANGPVQSRLGVFRGGQWFLDRNGDFAFDPATEIAGWGSTTDVPIDGDWNGDGYRDLGVYANGIWFLDRNGDGEFDQTTDISGWGLSNWIPVVGDWNGDGKSDLGVVEPSTMAWFRDLNGDGVFDPATEVTIWGSPGDTPVVGDWDGDGDDDMGAYSSGLWFRDRNGDGAFDPSTEMEGWGTLGAIPTVGDWNGDGAVDLGVFDEATTTWFRDLNGDGAFDAATDVHGGWGSFLGSPVVGDWDADGDDDLGAYSGFSGGVWVVDLNGDSIFDAANEMRVWGLYGWLPAAGGWK